MNHTLMVTGAHGFVAGSVLAQAPAGWRLHALSRRPAPSRVNLSWHVIDPLSTAGLAGLFNEIKPTAVINTAALADIDYCQTHVDEAHAVNAGLTRRLADLCAQTGTRLVHCSTDTIFDGENAPYAEDAAPGPLNIYAESKVEAEGEVERLGPLGVIARLSLVIGLPALGTGNSMLARLLTSLQQGRPVPMPDREIRTPIDVITAGRALLELAAGPARGVFHLAGLTRVNRVSLGRRLATAFGYSPDLIISQPPEELAGRAPRPRDVSLATDHTRSKLKTPFLPLDQALALILETSTRPHP